MPFTAEGFARKLRELRTSFGATSEEVSTATGLDNERFLELEAAQQLPSGDEVLIFSDYFGCSLVWLLNDDASNEDESMRLMFRAEGDKLTVSDRHAIKEFLHLCKSQALLEELLHLPPPNLGFKFVPRGTYYIGHGQQCAHALREWCGFKPNAFTPDVYEWFRRIGLRVFRRALPSSAISGLFLDHPNVGKCLLINFNEDLYRQRFSAAHEAGHALMDTDRTFNVSEEADQHSSDLREVRASVFASDFLIPPEQLIALGSASDWSRPEKIVEIADRLWVSIPALLSALVRAKLIDPATRNELRARGLRLPAKREPELSDDLSAVQRERKVHLLRMGLHSSYVHQCFEAYSHGLISQGKLAEMMLVKTEDLPEIAMLFGVTLNHG